MKIIEIASLDNGAHNNQTITFVDISAFQIPDGWAVIPDSMETHNFPFGEVEVAEINGVMTVTKWAAGTIPEPETEPDPQPTTEERVAALEAASDRLDAQATYTAMMTDTLMEG